MAGFDPDAFLGGTTAERPKDTRSKPAPFDPDAFLGAGDADRPEWLDKKSAQPPAPHSLDSLSADIARGKAALAQPTTLERGITGAAALGTRAVDAATVGLYSKARDAAGNAIGKLAPGVADATAEAQNTEQQFGEQHPFLANSASAAGSLAPWGAGARMAEAAHAGVNMAAEAAPAVAKRILTSRPVAGALVGGASNAATGVAQDAIAGASPQEMGANLLENAKTGAAFGGIGGAVVDTASGTRGAARAILDKAQPGAQARAVKDIAHDIVAAEGPRARSTDQKRISEVDKRLFELTRETPELRDTWRKSAEKALPEIEAAKRVAAKPLDGAYEAVDAKTGGGIRLGDIVDGFEAAAKAAGSKASGQAEAARFRTVKDNFLKAYGEPAFDPTIPVTKEGITAGQMMDMLEKAKARGAPGVDQQIAQVREMAAGGVNLDKRIPTALFREEVTDLHKTAEAAMGGLEGTARSEALSKLYQTGKQVIDAHLDASGIPAEQLAGLRKANDRYFLLSRAQSAIESRGWKESNRHTGFIAHTARQAADMSLPVAAGYAAMHPHAAPIIAATMGARALPAAASRVNWALANRTPGLPAGEPLSPQAMARMILAAPGARQQQPVAQAPDEEDQQQFAAAGP